MTYKELAEKYLNAEECKHFLDNLRCSPEKLVEYPFVCDVIYYAFDWSTTPQRQLYWQNVYEKIGRKRIAGSYTVLRKNTLTHQWELVAAFMEQKIAVQYARQRKRQHKWFVFKVEQEDT
jgi:hypothetical protein